MYIIQRNEPSWDSYESLHSNTSELEGKMMNENDLFSSFKNRYNNYQSKNQINLLSAGRKLLVSTSPSFSFLLLSLWTLDSSSFSLNFIRANWFFNFLISRSFSRSLASFPSSPPSPFWYCSNSSLSILICLSFLSFSTSSSLFFS